MCLCFCMSLVAPPRASRTPPPCHQSVHVSCGAPSPTSQLASLSACQSLRQPVTSPSLQARQSVNHSTSQPVRQPITQPTNPSTAHPVNHLANLPTSPPTSSVCLSAISTPHNRPHMPPIRPSVKITNNNQAQAATMPTRATHSAACHNANPLFCQNAHNPNKPISHVEARTHCQSCEVA